MHTIAPSLSATTAVAAAVGVLGAAGLTHGQAALEGWATADNEFEAYVSTDDMVPGTRFMEGNWWQTTYTGRFEFPGSGVYYLHVRAINGGGPAMFIGRFELTPGSQFENGTQTLLTVAPEWRVSPTGFGSAYRTPVDLGPNGGFPWGWFALLGAARFTWDPTETSTVYFSARIEAGAGACQADCDSSTGGGVLDIFDFLCFQNRFAAADPYACDFDTSTGTGVCDIFDFLAFQNAFAAGCP